MHRSEEIDSNKMREIEKDKKKEKIINEKRITKSGSDGLKLPIYNS